MKRLIGLLLLIGGCGDDPLPLTGQARWVDTCLREGMGRSGGPHVISGTSSSTGRDITCSMSMVGSEINVSLRAVVGDNIDSSNEGVFMSVSFGGVGQSANNRGAIAIRGVGWAVSYSPLVGQNSMYPCEVVLTRADLATRSFSGRFKCRDLRDDSTVPPRICQIQGQNNITADAEWGDFSFSNCTAD